MTPRNRWIVGAVSAVVVLALVIWLVVAGGDDDGSEEAAATTSSSTTSTTTTTSTTSTTTPAPTTTAPTGTTEATGPGPVTVLDAFSGGGSGEIELDWGAVDGATGYRVLRADGVDGPFTTAAEIDVTTGAATGAESATNVWSDQHTYLPPGDPFDGPDTSPELRYVEASGAAQRCFRVVAIGPAGLGPESAVVCGSPP